MFDELSAANREIVTLLENMNGQEECSSGSGEDDRDKVKEGAGRVVDAIPHICHFFYTGKIFGK